jgi:hypothetical protein
VKGACNFEKQIETKLRIEVRSKTEALTMASALPNSAYQNNQVYVEMSEVFVVWSVRPQSLGRFPPGARELFPVFLR